MPEKSQPPTSNPPANVHETPHTPVYAIDVKPNSSATLRVARPLRITAATFIALVDDIAPSLYANRVTNAKRSPEDEAPTTGVHPVVQPAPSEPSQPAPSLTGELNSSLAQGGPMKRSGG